MGVQTTRQVWPYDYLNVFLHIKYNTFVEENEKPTLESWMTDYRDFTGKNVFWAIEYTLGNSFKSKLTRTKRNWLQAFHFF